MIQLRLSILRVGCVSLIVSLLLSSTTAMAQRGDLVEDLFKTLAEAKLQREKDRNAASMGTQQETGVDVFGEERVQPRPGVITFPPKPGNGGTFPQRDPRLGRGDFEPRRIPPGDAGAAEAFRRSLSEFDSECARLVQRLRTEAGSNPAIRNVLPEAYRISADTRALVQNSGAVRQMSAFQAPYAKIDEGWRQLSFQLRNVRGLSGQTRSSIRACDDLLSRMSRQLQVTPQFDRHQLHDLMIVATTYMQCLMDDLQLARISNDEIRRLTHECRLLRQSLLQEAGHVHELTYDQIISRFTEFIASWRRFSGKVYALRDRHLERRLDRIRECGDQTYALLWMPAPYDSDSLLVSASRLESACGELMEQMTMRAMMTLSGSQRNTVQEQINRMATDSRQLRQAVSRGQRREEMQRLFVSIDRDWSSLSPLLRRMSSVNYATLSTIDHECGHLRDALDVPGNGGQSIRYEGLTEVAASLEASAAYLDADVKRYARYVGPATYQQNLLNASEAFYRDAKELHQLASQRRELQSLQRVATSLLTEWQKLSTSLSTIQRQGLPATRAANLQRDGREIASMVAKVSAALSQY